MATKVSYKLESTFVERALKPVREFVTAGKSRVHVVREVGVGRTIADIGMLGLGSRIPRFPKAPLTIGECTVVSHLRQSGATRVDILETKCGVERNALRDGALDRLLEWRLIEFGSGGRVALASTWAKTSTVYAVEAKLTRWKEALGQAVEYKKYANYSFVLLPSAYAEAAIEAIDEFDSAGVGLLILAGTDIVQHVKAKKTLYHGWRREFVCSRLFHSPYFYAVEPE